MTGNSHRGSKHVSSKYPIINRVLATFKCTYNLLKIELHKTQKRSRIILHHAEMRENAYNHQSQRITC